MRLLSLAACLVVASGISGCDAFSKVAVNCQLGIRNTEEHVGACEFRNTGREDAEACIRLHVLRSDKLKEKQDAMPQSFTSEKLCSGIIKPGELSDARPLAFPEYRIEEVNEACVLRDSDNKPSFHCQFEVEELP